MKNIIGVIILFLLALTTLHAQDENLSEYKIRVEGHCGMCKERIEKNAIGKGEAETADWDMSSKILTVNLYESKTSIMAVKWELAQVGHDNNKFKAPPEVYQKLHFCCQYREEEEPLEEDIDDNTQDIEIIDSTEQAVLVSLIQGRIFGIENGTKAPLIGANVVLAGTDSGTTTNFDGFFELDNADFGVNEIEVSYIGYEKQIIPLTQNELIEIVLNNGHKLQTVEVKYKKRTTEMSFLKPLNVETVTREELCKAACCNLSESFETNPSVDVSYTDAITGTRQIQMLGLAGPNVQITRELIPDVRAMSSIYGLSMTPGPWIESIQLIKGVGSVVNGFESITGQINVELKKPEKGDKFFLNGYVNNGGRVELNANARTQVSEKVSTGILIHGKKMSQAHDNNNDGFTDMPLEQDYVLINRWKFESKNGLQGQFGVKYNRLDHNGGYHNHFDGGTDYENHWLMFGDTKRYELWGKIGYINQERPENSLGLQLSYARQDQNNEFGFTNYDNEQSSLFANLVFQRIPNENHTIRTGLSFQMDDIDEIVDDLGEFNRMETVPGAYFEYAYKKGNKWSVIPGIRADYHNNYGLFITPRIHAKYNFSDQSIFRLVAGKGWRTASIFSENLGLFSSSRVISLNGNDADNPYGLNAEEAWNYGINFSQSIGKGLKEWIISLDFYRTDFTNQIVADFETPQEVSFYNLDGKSYSNSFQIKLEHEFVKNLDMRIAYRLFDVKTNFGAELKQKPLLARHRAFVNAAYKTESDWHFDMTVNWNGSKRLPYTGSNPEPYQRADSSPDFFLVNAQIMKRWGKKWDVYIGAENLLNYKQENAIVASDDPFGSYFDASMVWAPLFGTNIYLGFRYTIGE